MVDTVVVLEDNNTIVEISTPTTIGVINAVSSNVEIQNPVTDITLQNSATVIEVGTPGLQGPQGVPGSGGGGGVTDHALLTNLDYASAGHTGFQPAGSYLTVEADPIFIASEAAGFVAGDVAKLAGIEAGAEVNNISDINAIDLTDGGSTSLHSHAADHSPVTVLDSSSIDLSLSGQQITASAIFGTTGDTIASGNHLHTFVYEPIDSTIVRTGQTNWIDLSDGGTTTLHSHAVGVTTRSGIIYSTPPASGLMKYSSDTSELFIANGSNWTVNTLPLGIVESGASMGALPYQEDWGYGKKDIVNKYLHSVTLKPFDTSRETGEPGSLQWDIITHTFKGFINGEWKQFYLVNQTEVNDIALWSDLALGKTTDLYGNNRLHMEQMDAGAFATEHLITGGTII